MTTASQSKPGQTPFGQTPTEQAPVALVTGAAHRIGAAISRTLHQRGLRLALHCHTSTDAAQQLAREFNQQRPDSAQVVVTDLADLDAVCRLPQAVIDQWGQLDVLVHNASSFFPTPVATATAEQWDDLFNSNLRGPFFLSQAAAPALQARGGSIVCLVDIHADKPLRDHSLYCMAKAGLVMMVKSLAKELAPAVRVNGVAPGYILLPPDGMDEAIQVTILERTALARRGDPSDVAGAVAYLALDAPYVSGQILAVDGGRSLHM
ncbi:MAG: pteridine reductase [Wenzhouxiangellaceae bacterium]